ncbi:hypothetical protein LINPERPRIM_LOCUS43978 [Linum perenne]
MYCSFLTLDLCADCRLARILKKKRKIELKNQLITVNYSLRVYVNSNCMVMIMENSTLVPLL